MNANTRDLVSYAISIAATVPFAAAFLLSAAGWGLAHAVAPVSKAAAVKVSKAASAPWNKLIAE